MFFSLFQPSMCLDFISLWVMPFDWHWRYVWLPYFCSSSSCLGPAGTDVMMGNQHTTFLGLDSPMQSSASLVSPTPMLRLLINLLLGWLKWFLDIMANRPTSVLRLLISNLLGWMKQCLDIMANKPTSVLRLLISSLLGWMKQFLVFTVNKPTPMLRLLRSHLVGWLK